MVSLFWYIVMLVTNLSEPHTKDFHLKLSEGGDTNDIHVYHLLGDVWNMDFPFAGSATNTIPLNFKIKDKNILFTILENEEPIALDQFFEIKNVDWEKTEEIKVNELLRVDKATPVLVKRNANGFDLSQQKGFLQHYAMIGVSWK